MKKEKALFKEYRNKIYALQQKIKEMKIPVIICFEGVRGAGKTYAIAKLIAGLDPRGFHVHTVDDIKQEDLRWPWLRRFALQSPQKGEIAIFDHSWYFYMRLLKNANSIPGYTGYTEDIDVFERQLAEDGYLILKYFLNIDKKTQKKRLEKFAKSPATKFLMKAPDEDFITDSKKSKKRFKKMIEATTFPWAKWNVIRGESRAESALSVLKSVVAQLEAAIAAKQDNRPMFEITRNDQIKFAITPARHLDEYSLSKEMDEEEYRAKKKELQRSLYTLDNIIYSRKIPVVICFEGNDAAGKGGAIKRLTAPLDPRGYNVIPIAAPSKIDLAHQHLWRFLPGLPRTGHISIYDRTWYGRVLVERVEKLIDDKTVDRSYGEINEFEHMLAKWGAVILKFWIAIDKDEQLKRFQLRESIPEKRWKITEEDWRNRDKWDDYVTAVNDMFDRTNTQFAPWTVIEGNSKQYARVKVLETVVNALRNAVD